MNIDQAFPSDYVKAADLKGQDVPVVMREVTFEKVGDDQKPVLYFQGAQKGMVLNKTNANTIKDMYGAETAAWIGQTIVLFPMKVDFQGRLVDAIRCKAVVGVVQPPLASGVPAGAPLQPTAAAPAFSETNPPPPTDPLSSDLDGDEIPF